MPHLVSLFTALSTLALVSAKQCVSFDTSWNLYVFGGTSDYNLGQNTSWASPSPTTLTTTGRPPWTGNNTICTLSQYNNALYVLDADAANPGDIYVYNFGSSSWSTQTTTSAPDFTTGSTILDHDTNVFFTLPQSSTTASLYTLDFSTITTTATSSALAWEAVETPSFDMAGSDPVLGAASNHILFFNVPANPSGSDNLFVIHYSYFQPDAQAFAESGATTNFPTSHGQAAIIPLASNDVAIQNAFIPDDFSDTFIITHWTSASNYSLTSDAPAGLLSYINTTQVLPAPTVQDTAAAYASSDTTLVQFTSSGDIYYLPAAYGNGYAVKSVTWSKIDYTVAGLTGTTAVTSSVASVATSAASGTTSAASNTKSSGSTSSTKTGSTTAASSSAAAATSSGAAIGKMSGLVGSSGIAGLIGIAMVVGALLV